MGDDKRDRRQFLKGLVKEKEGRKEGADFGWKPGFEPATEADREENRRRVRRQLGDVEEPGDQPFDALDYLEGLAEERSGDNSAGKSRAMPLHRPPRALEEEAFMDACTRCGACIEACPHDAIELAGVRFREARGTPVINASRAPCRMCHDTPCVSVCEPGALRYSVGLSMGEAKIHSHDCIAHQGGICSVCVEQCPVPGAIKVRQGKPTIRQGACTGCGVCHFVCPAPVNAVRIFPRGIPQEVRDG